MNRQPRRSGWFSSAFSLTLLLVVATALVGSATADSTLAYSRLFGGSGDEVALGTAVDGNGNLYVTGSTASSDLPTSAGAPEPSFGGLTDAFVAKFAPDGSLLFATYLGGAGADEGRGIAVDDAGEVYVDGWTDSADFPTVAAGHTLSGSRDAFLVKLSSAGSVLFSTFIGGGDVDTALALALDPSGAAYVTGETSSTDFPTTPGAFATALGGGVDAYVTKVAPSGTIVYSTYLGGSGFDDGLAIAVSSTGEAFVTGKTDADFPVTAGAYDTELSGGFDMFVTKLDPSGDALEYSTYLGGSFWDEGLGIAVDGDGAAYVTGNVQSPEYPTTPGAYQQELRGAVDASITKLAPDGASLVYSTLLGGSSGWTEGDALQIDDDGNAYVAGHLDSADYPTTNGAFQTSSSGGVDGFLAKVDATGSSLLYSTYVGGSDWDGALTFALDGVGSAYVSGASSSSDFPLSGLNESAAPVGGFDVFATRIPLTTTIAPH